MDSGGPSSFHGGARLLLQLFRTDHRGSDLHAAAGPAAIAHAVLALCPRRDPGADRDRLPERHCGAHHRASCSYAAEHGMTALFETTRLGKSYGVLKALE